MREFPDIFATIAAHKRSIVLDLKSPDGLARALELAADADVVTEGFRPGVADRLGIGPDAIRAVNPDVVYCSISGFGQDGPMRLAPGHDLGYQAVAGVLSPEGRDPSRHARRSRGPTSPVGSRPRSRSAPRSFGRLAHRRRRPIDVVDDRHPRHLDRLGVGRRSRRSSGGGSPGLPGYGVFRTPRRLDRAERHHRAALLDRHLRRRWARRRPRPPAARAARPQRGAAGPRRRRVARWLDQEEALARLNVTGAPVAPGPRPRAACSPTRTCASGARCSTDPTAARARAPRAVRRPPRPRPTSPPPSTPTTAKAGSDAVTAGSRGR